MNSLSIKMQITQNGFQKQFVELPFTKHSDDFTKDDNC